MTETEWAAAESPEAMLRYLLGVPDLGERLRAWLPWSPRRTEPKRQPHPSPRKMRLYACACCRAIWELLRNEKSREAVETSERYADAEVSAEALEASRVQAWQVPNNVEPLALQEYLVVAGGSGAPLGKVWPWAARAAAETTAYDAAEAVRATDAAVERAGIEWVADGGDIHEVAARIGAKVRAGWLRDIIGDPLRSPDFDAVWRTPTVRDMAHAIYAERAFDRLPVLADALEEAGCTDTAILGHLRSPGQHVRGCWPVDLILDRS